MSPLLPRHFPAICISLCLLSFGAISVSTAKHYRVLMLGNSYTAQTEASLQQFFFHDPANTLSVTLVTPGGALLAEHAANVGTTNLITYQGPWDYVVLQEQSQLGAYAGGGGRPWNTFYNNGVKPLSDLAKDADAGVVLFMTWARAGNDSSTLPVFGNSPILMQDYIQSAYNAAGALSGSEVAPVGEAWEDALIANPSAGLHQADLSHPSCIGSFLTGAVLYEAITGLDVRAVDYNACVSAATGAELKAIAHFSFYYEWIGQFSSISDIEPCVDPDQDGVKNEHEWTGDTHPGERSSRLTTTVTKEPGNNPVITFESSPYRFYKLQASPNLQPGSWVTLRSDWLGTGSTLTHTDQAGGNSCRHYRLLPSIK